jgi:putative hydrolase of the HAD superfamily
MSDPSQMKNVVDLMRRTDPISPPPALVLFDLDDTLCDYAGARQIRLRTAFSHALALQTDMDEATLRVLIADSLEMHPHGTDHFADLFQQHGLGGAEEGAVAAEWYRAHRLHSLALFADAIETLTAVRQALPGRRIGLVTNGPSDIQRAKIAHLGVETQVDFIIVSEEFGVWKPEPAIFAEALRLGAAAPDDAIFIGDSAEHDIAGAQAAGIRTIWINPAQSSWPLESPGPDYDVANLSDVRRLLGGRSEERGSL